MLGAIRTCEVVVSGLGNISGIFTLRAYLASSLVADPVDNSNAASEVALRACSSAPPPVRTVVMSEAISLCAPVLIEAIFQVEWR